MQNSHGYNTKILTSCTNRREKLQAQKSKIKVALLGSRGIPARYGAFERFVQDLASYLPKDLFEIYVACESSLKGEAIHIPGVHLVYFPVSEKFRIISEVLYDGLSLVWASLKDLDIIYLLGYAAAPFCIIPRLTGRVVVINVDGLEWKRPKFPRPIRFLLRILEIISTKVSSYIISDSRAIQSYYQNRYNVNSFFLAYPAEIVHSKGDEPLKKLGLVKNEYYTVVARMEPENNIDLIVGGLKKARSHRKLVLIGPLKNMRYARRLLEMKDDHVVFLGGIYNQELLDTLRTNCFAYIHGHEVGGTNPSLLEALGCGNAVIALDVPFNREVARDAGIYFKKDARDLAEKIKYIEQNIQQIEFMRKKAREIIDHNYSKKKVLSAYLNTFIKLKSPKRKEV